MSEQFEASLKALGTHLGITLTTEEGIASLTLDGSQTIHLAALGDVQLAIFMQLSPLADAQQAIALLQHNLFSADLARPRVALSPDNYLIVWSQHPLSSMDGSTLYQALTVLREYASEWLSGDDPSAPLSSHDVQTAPMMMV
ncbi:CesT family type III secretion system chaperone [Aeromonas encheleia]|uniref:CesT family type III secretion system chaperone n=1 Tax=Aeromonas encheleia TaxID=73010 RepID=UPI001F57EC1B|nr:CesT family type III secretion system chaperone [Aeromonas encheleia]UNP89515.1 CesT family type III secretion system chaperone [Aeromonas encheleia]